MDSGKLTVRKGNQKPFGIRVCWIALGGVLLVGAVFNTMAQDRPAITRPSSSSKTPKEGDSSKTAKTSDKTSAEGEDEAAGPAVDIGKILPEGRILKGVKLPSYTGDRLSSVMTATTMKRLDEKHLDMEELRITMYAKPGGKNTLISTERGIYNLEKEEITSDTRTRIEQAGVFDLEGDNMVFDAVTQKGKMTGNVEMLVYKARESLAPKKTKVDKVKGEEKQPEEAGK